MTNVYSEAAERGAELLPVPARALTIGAHPDDAEFGAGGTLARWASAGCEVSMLIVTDGSKGTWEPDLSPAELTEMRRDEQQRAADALGATGQVIILAHPDGELEYSMELRRELCRWIRQLRPDVLLTHDPWRRYMLHPDHRVTGIATVDAVVAARDHLFFPDQLTGGLSKHRPDRLLFWAADEPDHWEDIVGTFEAKIGALLCHSSQMRTTMGDAGSGEEQRRAFEERIRRRAAEQGAPAGLALAEAFKMVRP